MTEPRPKPLTTQRLALLVGVLAWHWGHPVFTYLFVVAVVLLVAVSEYITYLLGKLGSV